MAVETKSNWLEMIGEMENHWKQQIFRSRGYNTYFSAYLERRGAAIITLSYCSIDLLQRERLKCYGSQKFLRHFVAIANTNVNKYFSAISHYSYKCRVPRSFPIVYCGCKLKSIFRLLDFLNFYSLSGSNLKKWTNLLSISLK